MIQYGDLDHWQDPLSDTVYETEQMPSRDFMTMLAECPRCFGRGTQAHIDPRDGAHYRDCCDDCGGTGRIGAPSGFDPA